MSDCVKTVVIGIPRADLVQKEIIESSLKTHNNLSDEDRKYATNEIVKLNLNDRDLASFIAQIYKLSNAGRFSLTYNLDLDTHIKERVSERIKTLVGVAGKEKAWPELYNNPYLTDEETKTIQTMSNREYYVILNTIENAVVGNLKEIIPCTISKDDILSLTDGGIKYTTIYSKCYDNVCISETRQSGKIISTAQGDIPQIAYVADGTDKNNKHCFKVMDLVKQLAKGNYINSNTNSMFSDLLLSQLLSKYEKEIKMYKRHIDILRNSDYNK